MYSGILNTMEKYLGWIDTLDRRSLVYLLGLVCTLRRERGNGYREWNRWRRKKKMRPAQSIHFTSHSLLSLVCSDLSLVSLLVLLSLLLPLLKERTLTSMVVCMGEYHLRLGTLSSLTNTSSLARTITLTLLSQVDTLA